MSDQPKIRVDLELTREELLFVADCIAIGLEGHDEKEQLTTAAWNTANLLVAAAPSI